MAGGDNHTPQQEEGGFHLRYIVHATVTLLVLLALLSQGYAPAAAALIGVWLHGAAGDCAAAQYGHPTALIASDIPQFFGKGLQLLTEN